MKLYKGFTLIELLVVIAIMGIVFSIGISYVNSDKYILKKEAMKLYSNLQNARSFSIRYKQSETITFNVSSNSYSLVLTKESSPFTRTFRLSDKVEYGDGGHGPTNYHTVKFGTGTTATFYPNGYCMPSGSVYLKTKNSDDYVYRIKVTIAGNIQILRWNGSTWVE